MVYFFNFWFMAKIFSDFTNLYEISKTLRFELKPTDETSHYLQKNNVF
ncbi:MAG: hypothetical protein LBF15_05810 [Candidatus Peribacteria bacterium]|nr:hypothetical protein [Candidatus Peribacteria bacterium]